MISMSVYGVYNYYYNGMFDVDKFLSSCLILISHHISVLHTRYNHTLCADWHI